MVKRENDNLILLQNCITFVFEDFEVNLRTFKNPLVGCIYIIKCFGTPNEEIMAVRNLERYSSEYFDLRF